MNAPTAAEVRAAIVTHVAASVDAAAGAAVDLSDDVDLLEDGLLDSFGLLELIGELERRYGVVLAFDDVDLDGDDLTRLGPLSRYVAAAPQRYGAEGAEGSRAGACQPSGRARRSQGPCHPETRRRGRRRGSSAGALRHRIVSTFALETRHSRSRSADRSRPSGPAASSSCRCGWSESERSRSGRACLSAPAHGSRYSASLRAS